MSDFQRNGDKNMAHRSAMNQVLGQQLPVYPKGGQPPYYRSKHSIQTSGRLARFHACIASAMMGKKYTDRAAVQSAFKSAAHGCKGK